MKCHGLWLKNCTFLLIIAILGGCFLSCGGEEGDDRETDEKNTDSAIVIASGGQTQYTLVRPSNADDELLEKTVQIYETIRDACGALAEMSDDFLQEGESADGRKEILIGLTNRPETAAVMDEIGYFDYSIREENGKIVIAAHTRQALMQAVDVFCEELLVKGADGTLTFGGDRTWHSEEQYEFFFSENPIENYRIVYPEGNSVLQSYAEQMATRLRNSFSVTLPVVSDAEPAAEYEILLGVTSREQFASCYTGAEAPDSKHYLIRAAYSNILIVGTNERSAELACKRFLNDYMDDRYSDRFNLPDGLNRYEVAYEADPDCERGEEVDLRIMSYNILSEELSPESPLGSLSSRKDLVTTTLLYYLPDVVGLQEVSGSGWALLEEELGDIYEFAGQKTPNGEFSYTGLMYNRNTVELLEQENVLYSVGNQRIRLMSWGLFRHRESGQQFIVMSTHWDIVRENRETDAIEMTAKVNELAEQYGCPIVTTGDFNTLESTPYFKKYLSDTAQTEARYAAAEIGFALDEDVIDHITSTTGLEPLFFKLLQTPQTLAASDHNPIWADFRFN